MSWAQLQALVPAKVEVRGVIPTEMWRSAQSHQEFGLREITQGALKARGIFPIKYVFVIFSTVTTWED